ncbi:cGMP-dependent protein kinase 1 [Liparis tanakae]|uniref:cGMP-dependent protein kinase 1 n=1 Tax=Liparis tanakae TaxID=230148 RepID=A0A4Z2GAC0_9TELE|nr:cGMP-dependent protein kinase 1 [Liparis tanakae]
MRQEHRLRPLTLADVAIKASALTSPVQERSIFTWADAVHLSAAKQGQTHPGQIEELRQRDTLIDELELELDTKDELIRRLQEELDRSRATVSLPGSSAASAACSAQSEDSQRATRKTVISESFTLDPMTLAIVSHRSCDKSPASQRLIRSSFLRNDLLKNLDEGEIRTIISCMYPTTITQGCYVIQEGANGAQAYVVEVPVYLLTEGRLDMTKDGLKLLTVEPEDVFGELALFYNCAHSFSVSGIKALLPFSDTDPITILTATIRGIDHIDFPQAISKKASSLIKKLCRTNPSERLGSQRNGAKDIQKHKWFEGLNWDELCTGSLLPPVIPKVKDAFDSSACGHYTEGSVELSTHWEDF